MDEPGATGPEAFAMFEAKAAIQHILDLAAEGPQPPAGGGGRVEFHADAVTGGVQAARIAVNGLDGHFVTCPKSTSCRHTPPVRGLPVGARKAR
jgi:hypothetical protein